uniref:WbqC family protein n=1 Tax=Flavobacterium sp. TaxID=239 RepID=UPI00404B1231
MNVLLHPTYFPSISHYVAMLKADAITFEMEDNFQKQSNRNRMYIYGPNGLQLLNIPLVNSAEKHQKYKDVKIDNSENWQKNHSKSLETAYRNSPFYEILEYDLQPVYEKKHTYLLDLNLQIFEIVNDCLSIELPFFKTTEYFQETTQFEDFRFLVNGKKDTFCNNRYTQVFEEKAGFLPNLSILDLLFNEGRCAKDYLKEQIF